MDLEDIMLSEIGQRKTNTTWSHLCMNLKKLNSREKDSRMVVASRVEAG